MPYWLANALLLNLMVLISNGLDGFAHAAEAMVGQALGENRLDRFKRVVKATGLCSFGLALLLMLLFFLGGHHLIQLLTSITEVQKLATALPALVDSDAAGSHLVLLA